MRSAVSPLGAILLGLTIAVSVLPMARVQATDVVSGAGDGAPASHSTDRSVPAGTRRTASPSINRRVAVLLINFARQRSQPWTKDFVREIFFGGRDSVADYYAEVSDGKVAITGEVFGYLTLNVSRAGCDYKKWGAAARAAATSSGIDLSGYTNIVYAFPWQATCWWAGYAKVGSASQPGRDSWINGLMSLFVATHELGHNFGANHAGSLTCRADGRRVSFSANCSTYAYGDPYDVMGYVSQHHMQTWYRWRLGFLTDSDVTTVNGDGTYRISTAELRSGSPRILRIPRPAGDYYYMEFRQPFGRYDDFAADAPPVTGVSIRIARVGGYSPTKLIDTTPESCTFMDAPLGVGRTFVDAINGISITTLAVSPTGADVRIERGDFEAQPPVEEPPAIDSSPPTAPGTVSAGLITTHSVMVSWLGAADDAGVDHYVVTADGKSVGTTCDLVLEDIPVADARTYLFGVRAVDAAGNVGPIRTASFAIPDVTAPSSPSRLTAVASAARSVSLRWKPANDNAAVTGYLLRRDGVAIAELASAATSYADTSLATGRTYRYTLTAIDAAHNAGPPAKVRVTLG